MKHGYLISICYILFTATLWFIFVQVLEDGYYTFLSVKIEEGARLTIRGWDGNKEQEKGGILSIQCLGPFVVENEGMVDLDGKGKVTESPDVRDGAVLQIGCSDCILKRRALISSTGTKVNWNKMWKTREGGDILIEADTFNRHRDARIFNGWGRVQIDAVIDSSFL